LGLQVCLRQTLTHNLTDIKIKKQAATVVVVIGSDQGMVGQFNESLAEYVMQELDQVSGETRVWAIGERMQARLDEGHQVLQGSFELPNAIGGIGPLITRILTVLAQQYEAGLVKAVYVYHNRPVDTGVAPNTLRLLPLDAHWRADILSESWPGICLPEVLGETDSTLLHFLNEYLYMALFRACAESLASENASRLAAMQRAEKNIGELLDTMHEQFHQLRQSSIDEELFDQVSGAQALGECWQPGTY